MFFMDWPLALTYLGPIHTHFAKTEPHWELFFSTHHGPSRELAAEAGYRIEPPSAPHDVAICCDGWSACPKHNRVVTFHGLASKGAELSSNRAGQYPGTFVAPSAYYADILVNKMLVDPNNIIHSGLSKFDTIEEVPALRSSPRVLFAPTHNVETSSIPVIRDRVYEIPGVEVHLHMYTRTDEHSDHATMRSYYPVHNATEDITALISQADIVIADFGSTVLEAMALGKMTIQVLNPGWQKFYLDLVEEQEMQSLPEVALPIRFAYQATSMDDVLDAIGNYPSFPKPDFEIVENIGRYRVSESIRQWIHHGCRHVDPASAS